MYKINKILIQLPDDGSLDAAVRAFHSFVLSVSLLPRTKCPPMRLCQCLDCGVQLHEQLDVDRQARGSVVCRRIQRQPRQRVVSFQNVPIDSALVMCSVFSISQETYLRTSVVKWESSG